MATHVTKKEKRVSLAFIRMYLKQHSPKIWRLGFFFLPKRPPAVSVMISFVCIVLFKSVSLWDFPPSGFAILQITSSNIALHGSPLPYSTANRLLPLEM